ncbi:MAG TPA: glutamate-5-semialdehyde dehydrogenase [Microbacteriaceae bacterium]|nr:glutamate-5-semialdehyde dehydrogenase [Microbacteriaceae bacterium]
MSTQNIFTERLKLAKESARRLANATTTEKNNALEAIANALESASAEIIAANASDLDRGKQSGLSEGLLDRLLLDEPRVFGLAKAVRDVVALPDPVGEVVRGSTLSSGIKLSQVRVPFGLLGAIYEARPNVTADIAAIALKSGNGAVLRGGSAAENTNEVLVKVIQEAVSASGLPGDAFQTVDDFGREGANMLMRARGLVDVLIPRGSAQLIATVVENSTVPVIETGAGVVHVFVDSSAEKKMALDIVVNSKTHRPSVCNAAETLLVHKDIADALLPDLLDALRNADVQLFGDESVISIMPETKPVTTDQWDTEHLALIMGVRVVDSFDEALDHIREHSTGHTDAIVTSNFFSAERFLNEVDSAVVMVNTSTRFTDGGEFGFGAEVGISTQKLHARGPMGLAEMTSTKWLVQGTGQIRK